LGGGEDFLFRIFFAKNFFPEVGNLTGGGGWRNESAPTLVDKHGGSRQRSRGVGERGRDREKRQQRPWAVEERVHLRILELLREGRGKVWIAQELGVGVQTVQRRAAVLRREDDEPGTVDFRKVRGEVCDKHGAVTVWPCVQCLAEEERAKIRSMN
jgi:hypothetical protein